jgi:hypothetical protein
MEWSKLDDNVLYTRKQLRKLGLIYSSTQFLRWEKAGLKGYKAPGRSSRVHYLGKDIKAFFSSTGCAALAA